MADVSPELSAALDAAKQRIKVDNYFTFGMKKGLQGHAQGLWSGMAIGGGAGALAGVCIGLIAAAAGIGLTVAGAPITIPALMLGTMAMGTVTGATVGSRIGTSTGSVSGVVGEFERRMRADRLEQEVLKSPEKQREVIEVYRRNPVVERETTIGEAIKTAPTRRIGWHKFFDPKTMVMTTVMCTLAGMAIFAGGAVLGGGPLLTALGFAAGKVAISTAVAVGAGVGAAFGLGFGVSYPMLFAGLTKGVADVLGQKRAQGKSDFAPVKTAEEMRQHAVEVRTVSEAANNNNEPTRRIQNVIAADRVVTPQQLSI